MLKNIEDMYQNFDEILKYTKDCRILIVEDNKELNQQLVDIFKPFFNVNIDGLIMV